MGAGQVESGVMGCTGDVVVVGGIREKEGGGG